MSDPEASTVTFTGVAQASAPAAVPPSKEEPFPLCPATWTLAAVWVAVYAAMIWHQGVFPRDGNILRFGAVLPTTSLRFGDLSVRSFMAGEYWRILTATFLHMSLLHLAINTLGLVQFGRQLEDWYGTPMFLVTYVILGACGNLLAVAARLTLHGSLEVHSAGGSVVLFGFVALMMVAGWRMRDREGDALKRWMLLQLLIYGVGVGFVARGVLDNFGHAGGALVGALFGFADQTLFRAVRPWPRRVAGAAAALLLILGGGLQLGAARRESDQARRLRVVEDIRAAGMYYDQIIRLESERGPFRTDPSLPLRGLLRMRLRSLDSELQHTPTPGDPQAFRRWREIMTAGETRWPTLEEVQALAPLHRKILDQAASLVAPAQK